MAAHPGRVRRRTVRSVCFAESPHGTPGERRRNYFHSGGFPRQCLLTKENRRCSILFHLLVPQ